jgi:NADPH:quinone reductase
LYLPLSIAASYSFNMAGVLQKVVRFKQTGPLSQVLTVESIPKPKPPPGYSLVQIHASVINPSDVGNVKGAFGITTLPRTPGRDFAGVVVDGPQESVGLKVWGTGGSNGFDVDGSHAEWILVPSDSLEEMPSNLSYPQAAACGVSFLTASLMLERASAKKGEYVMVLGLYFLLFLYQA